MVGNFLPMIHWIKYLFKILMYWTIQIATIIRHNMDISNLNLLIPHLFLNLVNWIFNSWQMSCNHSMVGVSFNFSFWLRIDWQILFCYWLFRNFLLCCPNNRFCLWWRWFCSGGWGCFGLCRKWFRCWGLFNWSWFCFWLDYCFRSLRFYNFWHFGCWFLSCSDRLFYYFLFWNRCCFFSSGFLFGCDFAL